MFYHRLWIISVLMVVLYAWLH